jgi:hypothetical protein
MTPVATITGLSLIQLGTDWNGGVLKLGWRGSERLDVALPLDADLSLLCGASLSRSSFNIQSSEVIGSKAALGSGVSGSGTSLSRKVVRGVSAGSRNNVSASLPMLGEFLFGDLI